MKTLEFVVIALRFGLRKKAPAFAEAATRRQVKKIYMGGAKMKSMFQKQKDILTLVSPPAACI